MRTLFLVLVFSLSGAAIACDGLQINAECTPVPAPQDGVWVGPSPIPLAPSPVIQLPPASLTLPPPPCFGDYGCASVKTRWDGQFGIVYLMLPDGYTQAGISGPCWIGDCPDLFAQAQSEAELKLKNALRYQRWSE